MVDERSILESYPEIFRRITLDEIDIIAKGETPKHPHYILMEDIPEILEVIKTQDEKTAVAFIAKKVRRV
jgi:hypothetical protein